MGAAFNLMAVILCLNLDVHVRKQNVQNLDYNVRLLYPEFEVHPIRHFVQRTRWTIPLHDRIVRWLHKNGSLMFC